MDNEAVQNLAIEWLEAKSESVNVWDRHCTRMAREFLRLQEVVRRYGDRKAMSFADPSLQQTIDDAIGSMPNE